MESPQSHKPQKKMQLKHLDQKKLGFQKNTDRI